MEPSSHYVYSAWQGCTKVSAGCKHCYAEHRSPGHWGAGKPRLRTDARRLQEPLLWNAMAKKAGVRKRVFCNQLSDWLDTEVPLEWFVDLLETIKATPHLDWLLLTKRPENFLPLMNAAIDTGDGPRRMIDDWLTGTAPANVWLGVSAEDQTRWNERVPLLLEAPAAVRFVSCEPLLGPLEIGDAAIDWVIAGPDVSARGARPMETDWVRSLRDQAKARGAAFWVKQIPANAPHADELDGVVWNEVPTKNRA